MRVRDLIAALIAEKKVQPNHRVKLAIHRIPINEDADATMLQNQTLILENREALNPIDGMKYILNMEKYRTALKE